MTWSSGKTKPKVTKLALEKENTLVEREARFCPTSPVESVECVASTVNNKRWSVKGKREKQNDEEEEREVNARK